MEEIYVTLLEEQKVGKKCILVKELDNTHDDEAIHAYELCQPFESYDEAYEALQNDLEKIEDTYKCYEHSPLGDMYVANSVKTVAHGTHSAGRLYDKFEKYVIVEVVFALKGVSICKVVELH